MNIEEAVEQINKMLKIEKDCLHYDVCKQDIEAIETLLTAYEKEKEKNKSIDEFCRKELAFKRRLQRENRQPDEFNQGRFYVSENIRKIIREE